LTDNPNTIPPEAIGDLTSLNHALDEHAIVSIADTKGNITYVNERFCSISGYSCDELIGQNHRMLKSNMHSPAFYEDMWQTIVSGNTWHGEIKNHQKDGGSYWVKATIVPILDEAGKPFQYVSIRTDITEHRETEEALDKLEKRFRISQSFANIGTWDWNIQNGDLYWSDRIPVLFGGTEGGMTTSYDNFLNAIHPDDRQSVVDAVNDCVENDAEYDIEHRVVWPDGTVVWLHETGNVTKDKDGKPLNMLGVVRDVDDRKKAEQALAERERQLRDAQSLAHLGSWEANLMTGELRWSDEIFRIFGHEPNSFHPSIEAFRAAVHPDDLELVIESEKRSEQTGYHNVIHRIVLPNGSVRHVHELARTETDADGKLLRMIGSVQDVTERRLTETALNLAKEEADKANKAKSEFLSSMSHELRTPMNAILGFTQMLQYNPQEPLTKSQESSVDLILRGGHHLLELIDQVLELSKIEAGHISLNIDYTTVREVINDSLNLIQSRADTDGIKIIDQTGRNDLPLLWTDSTRLTQVLLNLLSNAVKYNNKNGTVTLTCQETPDRVLRISVADTGMGIPTEKQDGLFKPFDRLGLEAGSIEGTGIGLTITKQIVELLGGSIGFESEMGKGSTFWIDVPMSENQDAGIAVVKMAASTGKIIKKLGEAGSKYSVLYVEDNPANMQLMEMVIGQIGNTKLLSAYNAELGLDLAKSEKPDLILMDINLPGINGVEALNQLQDDKKTKDIPVIAITAAAMSKDVEAGLKAGFSNFITKPINVPDVIRIIQETLESIKK
jgi:PAS domain S-box-containing protein